jgi:cystathionine gamma-lyase
LSKLQTLISAIKKFNPNIICFVDNCYGEFTQTQEPTDIGADIIAGSLIKNPGGGIVAAGAYIAGKQAYVDAAAESLTAPGIGSHGGCMFDQTRLMMQGFFMAPLIVSEALKGMSLAAYVFSKLGYETIPAFDADRNDIIQSIKLGSREALIDLCAKVQANSAVNSMFSPVPSPISGYDDEIIMASGSFIEGSSIELSCDGPLREPFIAYLQGGLSYAHTELLLAAL